jgi:hypothetical protein
VPQPKRTRDDDDDAFDERGVLKDGRSYRVTDSLPAHYDEVRVTDGGGHSGLALQRPGFRVADAGNVGKRMRDEIDAAYADVENDLTNAWKNKPPTGFGSGEFIGQREGDLCTIDGAPGRLCRDDDGELTCMADHPSGERDARTIDERMQDHKLRMTEEYNAYDRALRDAWRRP